MNSFGRGDDKKIKNRASVVTRETVGMTLLLFGVILFFIGVTGAYVFGDPGAAITAFFVGVFGYFFYPLDLFLIYLGLSMVVGKRFISAKWLARGLFLLACVFFLVHTATAEPYFGAGYGEYLAGCWNAAVEGSGTGGGVLLGLIAFPVRFLLSAPGAYVLFSLLTLFSIFLIVWATPLRRYLQRGAKGERAVNSDAGSDAPREVAAPVAFDDLAIPTRRTMARVPELDDPEEIPDPSPAPYRGTDRRAAAAPSALSSREILFGNDPASSYKNNLIFDSDSQFNTRPRRSSVLNTEQPEQTQTESSATRAYTYQAPKPDYAAPLTDSYETARPSYRAADPAPSNSESRAAEPAPSYSERYLAQTESTRPVMPRKITPVERVAPATDDYSYTQTPSYRAPSAPAPEQKEDFYSHDVEPEETVYESPAAEPEATEEPTLPPSRISEPLAPARETSQTRADEEYFRSIFSRPVERNRTEISAQPAEPEAPAEPVREERFSPLRESRETPRFGFGTEIETPKERDESESTSRVFDAPMRGRSAADLFDGDDEIDDADYREEPAEPELPARSRGFGESSRGSGESSRESTREFRGERFARPAETPVPEAPAPAVKPHVYKPYLRPGLELFQQYDDTVTVSQDEIEHNSSIIVETLAGFRVDAEVVKVRSGSAVTRYDIDIPKNIAVRTVIKRDAEIAMRLHARDGVNIYANSEMGAISIEVPNSKRATVGLRSVLLADEYVNAKHNSLMFAIGKDIEGRNVCGNIVKMKHILVAGSTGSGKSVCLNAMLISLISRYSPAELRLILIDPKKVEFAIFDGLPHLMINEIIADAQKAVTALNWAIKEMERRYSLFEQKTRSGMNVHNLDEYNATLTEDEERLPKIVIVVDELADLMSVAKKDIEDRIQRLAQKARAAGMHLVIATQRPSVDVITGVIKGNLPTRLAFRVIQEVDSRTILDESGAEKLLGNGDMLYRTEGMFNCLRVQGAFISSAEVQAVIENIKMNNEAYFDESVADYINKGDVQEAGSADFDDGGSADPFYIKALGIVVKLGTASISLIQRKCSVGYNHAGKIIEWMELMGYISPFDGKAKARTVLLTKEDYESKYGRLD